MLRVGVIGLNAIGHNHAGAYRSAQQADLVCVCDKLRDRADEAGSRYDCKVHYEVAEMLREERLDAVSVATGGFESGGDHYEPAMQCLNAGVHVLCEKHAISKIHPDLATSGGILETHKIGDMAEEFGVPMAMHFAGTPVSCMANVHCAAATQNFLALENHSLDVPWWSSLVQEYVKSPIVNHGWIEVPDRPGLGVTLNEDVVRQHLAPGTGYFEPTAEWDHERSWDRLWS